MKVRKRENGTALFAYVPWPAARTSRRTPPVTPTHPTGDATEELDDEEDFDEDEDTGVRSIIFINCCGTIQLQGAGNQLNIRNVPTHITFYVMDCHLPHHHRRD